MAAPPITGHLPQAAPPCTASHLRAWLNPRGTAWKDQAGAMGVPKEGSIQPGHSGLLFCRSRLCRWGGRARRRGRGNGEHPLPTLGPGEEMSASWLLCAGGSAKLYLEQKQGHGHGDMGGGRGRLHAEATSQGPRAPRTRQDREIEALSHGRAGSRLASTSSWQGSQVELRHAETPAPPAGPAGLCVCGGEGTSTAGAWRGAGAGSAHSGRAGARRPGGETTTPRRVQVEWDVWPSPPP